MIEARESLGMTRQELADYAGVALTTITYVEKGAYGTMPSRLIHALEVVNPNIMDDYNRWKLQARLVAQLPLTLPEDFPSLSDIMHPHIEFRQVHCGLSMVAYAETLCIARHVVQNYEKGRQAKFPKEMKRALIMVLPVGVVDRLVKECDDYGHQTNT